MEKNADFDVFLVVKEAQNQHGLRHNDFLHYMKYCSRKLRRLRGQLQLRHNHGKGFSKKRLDKGSLVSDKQQVAILYVIFRAERLWSYAMHLRNSLSDTEKPLRRRHHIVRLLRRAYRVLQNFAGLMIDSGLPTKVREQIALYTNWLNSQLLFEQRRYLACQEVLNQLKQRLSRTILTHPIIFAPLLEEAEARIRYCSHILGGNQELTESKEKEPTVPDSLSQQIGQLNHLDKVTFDTLSSDSQSIQSIFDPLLIALNDVVQSVSHVNDHLLTLFKIRKFLTFIARDMLNAQPLLNQLFMFLKTFKSLGQMSELSQMFYLLISYTEQITEVVESREIEIYLVQLRAWRSFFQGVAMTKSKLMTFYHLDQSMQLNARARTLRRALQDEQSLLFPSEDFISLFSSSASSSYDVIPPSRAATLRALKMFDVTSMEGIRTLDVLILTYKASLIVKKKAVMKKSIKSNIKTKNSLNRRRVKRCISKKDTVSSTTSKQEKTENIKVKGDMTEDVVMQPLERQKRKNSKIISARKVQRGRKNTTLSSTSQESDKGKSLKAGTLTSTRPMRRSWMDIIHYQLNPAIHLSTKRERPLAHDLPSLRPICSKPFLFDIAGNSLRFPLFDVGPRKERKQRRPRKQVNQGMRSKDKEFPVTSSTVASPQPSLTGLFSRLWKNK